MEKPKLDDLSYAAFADEFAIMKYSPTDDVRFKFNMVTNTDNFSTIVNQLSYDCTNNMHFMGIIGDVDTTWSIIAGLKPKKAFLFDERAQTIPYLGLRLHLLKQSRSTDQNYLKMICVEQEKIISKLNGPISIDSLIRAIGLQQLDPQIIAAQGSMIMKNIGYTTGYGDIDDVFLDTDFRKQAAIKFVKNIAMLKKEFKKGYAWFSDNNILDLRILASGQHIKGFRTDFYQGFSQAASRIIDEYDIKNLVIYTSRLQEIETNSKSNSRTLSDAIKGLPAKVDNLFIISKRKKNPKFSVWLPHHTQSP